MQSFPLENLLQIPKESERKLPGRRRPSQRQQPPAPPLPLAPGPQLVEYDVALPHLVDYDVLEYSVDLGDEDRDEEKPSPELILALFSP